MDDSDEIIDDAEEEVLVEGEEEEEEEEVTVLVEEESKVLNEAAVAGESENVQEIPTKPVYSIRQLTCKRLPDLDHFLRYVIGIDVTSNQCSLSNPVLNAYNQMIETIRTQQSKQPEESRKGIVEALQSWISTLSVLGGETEVVSEQQPIASKVANFTVVEPPVVEFVDPCGSSMLDQCYAGYQTLYNRPAFVCLPVPFYVRHLGIHGVQFYDGAT